MHFNAFQTRASETSQFQDPQRSLASSIWNLNETVSALSRLYDERDRAAAPDSEARIQGRLGDALWYVSNICTSLDLQLDEVARDNLEKCNRRWGKKTHEPGYFDGSFPKDERFPRTTIWRMRDLKSGQAQLQRRAGDEWNQIGARVTDNAHKDDGYRFHDALHLAYLAVLGWSPVLRALMNRKRKSNPHVDEVEDGARAQNLEEGLTAVVYEYAKDAEFFENVQSVPFEVLKLVERLTRGLEVNSVSYELWSRAILQGYEAWRFVNANGSAYLKCDMKKRTLSVAKAESKLG